MMLEGRGDNGDEHVLRGSAHVGQWKDLLPKMVFSYSSPFLQIIVTRNVSNTYLLGTKMLVEPLKTFHSQLHETDAIRTFLSNSEQRFVKFG